MVFNAKETLMDKENFEEYWISEAERAQQEGFIGVEESERFIVGLLLKSPLPSVGEVAYVVCG